MKPLFLFILITSFCNLSPAQHISKSINSSSGGTQVYDQGFSIEWTIGDQFFNTTIGDNHLTEGFQQGALMEVLSEKRTSEEQDEEHTETELSSTISAVCYPNPTTDQLFLIFSENDIQDVSVSVYNLNGQQLFSQEIIVNTASPVSVNNISELPSGLYILKINCNNSKPQTITFQKTTR